MSLLMDFFQSFIDVATMPVNGEIYARVSDNVLDDDDYTVYELNIRSSIVIGQTIVHEGCYPYDFIGMTTLQLTDWSARDETGSHPENYYELARPHTLHVQRDPDADVPF